jgi:hypothetical protein
MIFFSFPNWTFLFNIFPSSFVKFLNKVKKKNKESEVLSFTVKWKIIDVKKNIFWGFFC